MCERFPELRGYGIADRERVYRWALDQYGERMGSITIGAVAGIVTIITAAIGAGIKIAQIVKESRAKKRIDKDWAKAEQIRKETTRITNEANAMIAAAAEQEKEQKTKTYTALALTGLAAVGAFFI